MTIPVSTIGQARTYLFNQINALAVLKQQPSGIPPTFVRLGPRGKYAPFEIIEIGHRIDQDARVHAIVGSGQAGFLEESYTIGVDVQVGRPGDDEPACFARCEVIVDAIDNALRLDPSAGNLVQLCYPEKHVWDSVLGTKGRVVTCLIDVRFQVVI